MLWQAAAAAAAAALLLLCRWIVAFSRRTPQRMFAVYTQPDASFYPKMAAFWLLLRLRRLWGSPGGGGEQAGYGPLAEAPQSLDAVLIQGADGAGAWLVAAMARRPHGVLNVIGIVSLPGVGTLLLPRHPDTTLFGGETAHAGGGFSFRRMEPMRRWKLDFTGQMRVSESGALVDVTLDLTYTSDLAHFDFDTDMAPLAVARAMAREPWSREFFARLRDAHQTHYEQIGTTEGTVTVDGRPHALRVTGMRDHSYARCRDWTRLHRYGLHTLIVEDGTRAQVGVVSQPYSFSRIELGYVYRPDGSLHALEWCDLELGYHGEQGAEPRDYGFSFGAGGRTYRVLVKVEESHTVFIGWRWEARVLERRCTYRVNGVAAHGVSEWYYRHRGGRPAEYAADDPAWARDIEK
ncbi:uncharacterized protein LOC119113449 [Pollicipes pollicipes]|uniref:uncharacterized protein LOC119113449 n=1 Tax=Pollicipes pollicipes TaxID=41117 RepID=UPI0018850775|nr:uncharacterized protein LOC119113449 [Pollicipes pollicipes]